MKQKVFSRTDVEDHCTAFLGALLKNPNFCDPDCGGAAEEFINDLFLAGIQTSHFRERTKKYKTKTVNKTYSAIMKVLPKYQQSLAMDICVDDH